MFPYFPHFPFCQMNSPWSSPVCSSGAQRSRECLRITQKMDLSDSSQVADTEMWMTYLFSVITMPPGFQSNVIYTGTSLQGGGGLDGFAIWRHAVCSLGWKLQHTFTFQTLQPKQRRVCNENQHLPASETKDKYGKMATRGRRRIGLNEFYCITREMAACTCQKNIIFILNEWVYLC